MANFPRPERLLPPRLLEAMSAAQAGEAARALELCAQADARDPLAGDVVRLVRGLVALEKGERPRAHRELLALAAGDADPALALSAALALADDLVALRRFVPAMRLLRRIHARQNDAAARHYVEAAMLAVELRRRGGLDAAALDTLVRRLDRRAPAPVHAAVHLLCAERALLAGDLPGAVAAHREARPYARSSGVARLLRRQEAVASLLRAPFADVEDWEEPLRTVSREELAEIESRPWQLWIDALHRRVSHRGSPQTASRALGLGDRLAEWSTLEALARSPRRRLAWPQAQALLGGIDAAAARERATALGRALGAAGVALRITATGFGLDEDRFVLVFPAGSVSGAELRILGRLAERPGASAADLCERKAGRSALVRHLARLRRAGYLRMVGGGNEARYFLV